VIQVVPASAVKEEVVGILVGQVAEKRNDGWLIAAATVLKSGEIRTEGFVTSAAALRWADERNGVLTVYSDVCGLLYRWADSPVWMKSPGFMQSLQGVR
jgi:hypothetical protein